MLVDAFPLCVLNTCSCAGIDRDYFGIKHVGNLQKVQKTIKFNKLKSELLTVCRTYLSFQIMQ